MGYRIGLLLAVLFCALSSVSAQTSITETIALDKRLEKKVTIEVVHTKLADVTDSLAKQTGVTIKAGTSVKDWKPRERKVTIFAKDIPAGELLKEIAALLDFKLTASGKEGRWEYRLWLDRKSRQQEEEAVAASKNADQEKIDRASGTALDVADEALRMTQAEAMAKRESSPWLAFLGGTYTGRGLAKMISYLNKQRPEDRAMFLSGESIEWNVADLPADVQLAVIQAAAGTLARFDAGGSDASGEVTQVTIEPSPDDDSSIITGVLLFGYHAGGSTEDDPPYQQSMGSLPIVNPGSPISKFLGEFAIRAESGSDPQALEQEFEALLMETDGSLVRDYFNHDSPTRDNPPTDPELTREIEIKKVGEGRSDPTETGCDPELAGEYVREISRATGWPVLFESFDSLNNFPALIKLGKQPLYKVLIALEESGYL